MCNTFRREHKAGLPDDAKKRENKYCDSADQEEECPVCLRSEGFATGENKVGTKSDSDNPNYWKDQQTNPTQMINATERFDAAVIGVGSHFDSKNQKRIWIGNSTGLRGSVADAECSRQSPISTFSTRNRPFQARDKENFGVPHHEVLNLDPFHSRSNWRSRLWMRILRDLVHEFRQLPSEAELANLLLWGLGDNTSLSKAVIKNRLPI